MRAANATQYMDDKGRLLCVSSGISGGALWMTVYRLGPHSSKRYRGIEPCPDRAQAQTLLDDHAKRKSWFPVPEEK